MAQVAAGRGSDSRRGGRAAPRAAPARGAVRGEPPTSCDAARARRRVRRHRRRSRRRRAHERPSAPRRLSGREQVHDLGLQVRPARGRREAPKASLAGREIPLEPEDWGAFSSVALGPEAEVEQSELIATLRRAIDEILTPHQRRVLVALALNGCRSTSSQRGSTRLAVRCTRRCTTHATSCVRT